MIKLRYQGGDIRFNGKWISSMEELSEWDNLKSHISSLSSKSDPLTFIHILEGSKIIVASNNMSEKETIEWSNLNVTLWNAVKVEIEAL